MEQANNIIVLLSVLLLLISIFGTVLILNNANFGIAPPAVRNIQQGEVKLTILPDQKSVSTTGYIGVNIIPSEQ